MLSYYRLGQTNVQCSLCNTVWEFRNGSIAKNLREINFGDSRGAKSTILTRLEALNFDILNFCIFLKAEI